jgi:hypothetical protein
MEAIMSMDHRSRNSTTNAGRNRVRRALSILAIAATALAPIACGGDATGPGSPTTSSSPVGTFSLTSLNGKALPAILFADTNYTVEITVASLNLSADGKYTSVVSSRETVAGNISTYVDTAAGSWTQSASALTFTSDDDGAELSATFASHTLTFMTTTGASTQTWIYAKN